MYKLLYSPQAKKDAKKLARSGLRANAEVLLDLIEENPYAYPPEYEFLSGKLKGFISRRINKQHRLVYQVLEREKIIKVLRMWTHYE
jgi:Txe/YoeB family toxin of toxin-antitoxin system